MRQCGVGHLRRRGGAEITMSASLPDPREERQHTLELRRHKGITTAGVGSEVLRRVPVHELTAKHRMGHAPDLMFNGKQLAAGLRVDNVLEAILIGIAFLSHEAMLLQERMWT